MVAAVEWKALRLDVPAALADAIANFLLEEGAPGVITAVDDPALTPPLAGRSRLEAHVRAVDEPRVAAAVARYLRSLGTIAPEAASARLEVADVGDLDWEATFRLHHRALDVGRRLRIAPPWDVPAADDGRIVLVVEPGMAFGTGQHATTRACLAAIEDEVGAGGVDAALDVGTGSGLLAAALVRLGVPHVVALDVDPAVMPLARANLARNAAGGALLLAGRVAAVRGRFALVVANLLADALVAEASALAVATAPRGRLVVSGLLAPQVPTVLAAYPEFRVTAQRAEDAWRTLTLTRGC